MIRFHADSLNILPEHLRDGMQRYIEQGVRPGSFLCSCIDNNALEASTRAADTATLLALPDIMKFLFNDCPQDCWGSPSKREAWVKVGGLGRVKGKSNGS